MRFKNVYNVMALAAVVGLVSVAPAALIGILPSFPTVFFNNQGSTTYDAATDLYAIDASPIAIRFSAATPPRLVVPTGVPAAEVLTIRMIIDDQGTLVGGVEDEDLIVTGEVDQDGDGIVDYAGVLLTGEVAEFGFLDLGPTDLYDFRFTVTGGALADDFFTNKDIGVRLTSESSDFGGVFTAAFAGGAKGVLGPIDLPPEIGACTPGYWKQRHHFDSWPTPYLPGMTFESVFERDVPGNPLLSEALRLKRGGINALMRHATAALLNAASPTFTSDETLDTAEEVIAAFQVAFDSEDYETTKNLMEDSNEAGCPLN